MSDLEADALTLLLVKVVRDRLALLDDAARERVKAALKPGARWIVTLPGSEVEVGGVTRTKPAASKPAPIVADAEALLEWCRQVHPSEVWQPPAPAECVRPAFVVHLVNEVKAGAAEWPDPSTGEVLALPPGIVWSEGRAASSTLQVRSTAEGEAALLEAMRSGALALPAVLDEVPAIEGP